MNTISRVIALSGVILSIGAAGASAQLANPTADMPQFIRVTGEALVGTAPDEVMIDLGVTTQARSAQEAATENAKKVESLMAVLKKEAGEGAIVQTIHYGLNPDYRPMNDGNEPPIISSYTAYNMIRVRTAQMTRVGRIIDASIAAGANTIQSVQFVVNETNDAHTKALGMATANAMKKAEAIAAGLKMRVRRILSVDEGGSMMPYRGYNADMRSMQTATTIEAGAVDVRGAVTLTVEVGA